MPPTICLCSSSSEIQLGQKLVIVHIDGVSANVLERALREGVMPFVQHLIDSEGYALHRYRCGVPSTTPFAQAGILYGDNSEIPSFRWWDREQNLLVHFGYRSTFGKVADKHFQHSDPLTKDGACIAACYSAGAADDFGISYQERSYSRTPRSRSALRVLVPYVANPVHLGDWLWQTVRVTTRTTRDMISARLRGRHPARSYIISDVLEEIFVHHLTRYAVEKAMREGYSPIYGGFYAFDETAHAFGPGDPSAIRILKQVDQTIERLASKRGDEYELLLLSDHGQVDTIPFADAFGRSFGAVIAEMMPGYQVQEMKGQAFGPAKETANGTIYVTLSGGLAHLYVGGRAKRMQYSELAALRPNLAVDLSAQEGVGLVMAREGPHDIFIKDRQDLSGAALEQVLEPYDEPDILVAQLSRLNSFGAAGDLIVFGGSKDDRQVNFENQAGGHGSIGGEQLHPFVLAKKDWGLDTSSVRGAHELYPVLRRLRDHLLEGGLRSQTPQMSRLHDDHGQQNEPSADDLHGRQPVAKQHDRQ